MEKMKCRTISGRFPFPISHELAVRNARTQSPKLLMLSPASSLPAAVAVFLWALPASK